MGLVTPVDRAALAGYADAWARFVEASLGLQKHGMLVKGRMAGEPVRSPYLAVVNQSLEQMKSFLIEFGMTPSSRERLSVQIPREPTAFEKFLAGGPPPNQSARIGGNVLATESDD
jgi:P27 family predicted phage terminase small subunit